MGNWKVEDLLTGIPLKYVLQLSVNETDGRYVCAVHINWLRFVISERKIPPEFQKHESLTDDQIFAFINQGKSQPLGAFWTFIDLKVHSLSRTRKLYKNLQTANLLQPQLAGMISVPLPPVIGQGSIPKTRPQIIDFIGEANFNYVWEKPYISLLDLPEENLNATPLDTLEMGEDDYFEKLLELLYANYKCSIPESDKVISSSPELPRFSISNLAQPLSIIVTQSGVDENFNKTALLFYAYAGHTLEDCVNFSPQKLLASNVKQLFVLYQILQLLHDLELLGIPPGDLTLSDFWTDECLHIVGIPNLVEVLQNLEVAPSEPVIRTDDVDEFLTYCIRRVKDGSSGKIKQLSPELFESIIRHWCEGLVSNYEYLMFLNYLAGRSCNVNPNYHPVFPWVNDFSGRGGGWRDLTKSKFRLNKGERQLDLMFEEKGGAGTAIPHHVTDILSEITYYVYKARRTSKEVLCKFVRPKWVPAEYPMSIQRMQDWTPDECIPEFYDDPKIFESIHPDLPDLLLPSWSSSPEEFIQQHRDLLESDQVSSKLHHWIDLTFGYKLSGIPAVKSKNVYLSAVDNHQNLSKNGIIQLFQTPHPPRRSARRDLKNQVKYVDLKRMRENDSHEKDMLMLPRNYDPCGFLNDFEVCLKFFKTHFNNTAGIKLKGIREHHKHDNIQTENDSGPSSIYVKLIGCLMVELVIPHKLHYVSSKLRDIPQRFEFYRKLLRNFEPFPIFIKRAIQVIFARKMYHFAIPLEISIELLLLNKGLSPIPFPNYFPAVYKVVRGLRNYDSSLSTSDPLDLDFRTKVEELKVRSFSRDLTQILDELDEEGLELVLHFVLELFQNPNTRVLAVWNLFCPFSRAIGRQKTVKYLLQPIIQIYESDYSSDKHVKLFHRSFLLQLQSCFGLEIFLQNFTTLLIEAIGGWKQPESISINPIPVHLKGMEDIEASSIRNVPDEKLIRKMTRGESISYSADGAGTIPEVFLMDPELSDSEEAGATRPDSGLSASVVSVVEEPIDIPLVREGSGHSNSSVETRSSTKSSTQGDLTEMCSESVMWLTHRLGPVLSAKYISRNLLRMLTLCYLGHLESNWNNPGEKSDISEEFSCQGDLFAQKILDCLVSISDLYGDSFIERQYIPYAIDVVNSAKKRMTVTIESALLGVSSLIERILNCMEDALLVSLLNEAVIGFLLKPILELGIAPQTLFPSGFEPRVSILKKLLSMLKVICRKIGPDISEKTLKPLVLQLCSGIPTPPMENEEENVMRYRGNAFGQWVASYIHTNFFAMVIGSEYEGLIRDIMQVRGLSASIPTRDSNAQLTKGNPNSPKVEQQSSFGSRSFGNRVFVHESEGSDKSELPHSPVNPPKDTTRNLKGNWLVYWEHEVGRSASQFNFKQIKLQSFSGHTASVRSIWSLNNENSFLTASKDKTCRVYSLRNQGDETTVASHKWTYTHHKKAVLSVLFNEPLHLAASTDGTIHIWDPFVGKVVRVLEPVMGRSIRTLKPMSNCSSFVGAGIENFLTVVDPRTSQSYELKMGIGQNTGLVRCMSVSPAGDVVSVGHSSGMISSLDLRGTLMGSWKAHEGEVLQLINHNRHLISSSLDQHVSVWNLDDNKFLFNMRGTTEPVHSMSTFESELLSCTTSNRIGVHNRIDASSDFSSTRLRSDTFKGIVTTINLLPLNQLLLLGGDSGLIALLC